MNIGETIKLKRKEKNLTQENMAEWLHISKTVFADIELNKTEVTINRLQNISKILDINLNEILEIYVQKCNSEEEIKILKAEWLLAQIENIRWKDRFLRSVFADQRFRQKH